MLTQTIRRNFRQPGQQYTFLLGWLTSGNLVRSYRAGAVAVARERDPPPCCQPANRYKRAAKAMLQAIPLSPPTMRAAAERASRERSAADISPMPCMRK